MITKPPGDRDGTNHDNFSLEGNLYESYEQDIPQADPITGTPKIEILIDQTISRAFTASEYLKGVLLRMGLSGRIAVNIRYGSIHLEILGAEPGLVIGHRGQNLDALQHIINRMVNKDSDDLVPVTVDADNYRGRRLQQLEKLVRSVCREVLDFGKAVVTEPMTPSERRLFHISANKIHGVRTSSFGSGFFQPIKVFPAHLAGHALHVDPAEEDDAHIYQSGIYEHGDFADESDFSE
ncbi:MAG: KH domain-containing protein [bacterium]